MTRASPRFSRTLKSRSFEKHNKKEKQNKTKTKQNSDNTVTSLVVAVFVYILFWPKQYHETWTWPSITKSIQDSIFLSLAQLTAITVTHVLSWRIKIRSISIPHWKVLPPSCTLPFPFAISVVLKVNTSYKVYMASFLPF